MLEFNNVKSLGFTLGLLYSETTLCGYLSLAVFQQFSFDNTREHSSVFFEKTEQAKETTRVQVRLQVNS